jgi:glutaredoxin
MPDPSNKAVLYRMVMPEHICPFGLKSLALLKSYDYEVDDRHLKTRGETEDFKKEHGVKATPQTFIGGQRIGGYDELRGFLGLTVKTKGATNYAPVVALFGMAAAMALAIGWDEGGILLIPAIQRFVAIAMCLLSLQKLRDLENFTNTFLNYDLLARRWVRYAYLYPWAEGLAGVLMLAGVSTWLSVPLSVFIGAVGAASVIKAVYIDKRQLKCACVGGDSTVPLGFISLTENLMMVAMGLCTATGA